jgi:hypothetical protein
MNPPCLAIDDFAPGECAAREQGEIDAFSTRSGRKISDHEGASLSCRICQILTRAVVCRMSPNRGLFVKRPARKINSSLCREAGCKSGVLPRVGRPGGVRGFREEQQPIERQFRDRGPRIFRERKRHLQSIRLAETVSLSDKARRIERAWTTNRVGACTPREDEASSPRSVPPARLLFLGVRELQRRDVVLGFDRSPTPPRQGA